jgi:hypothetical protein
MADARTKQRAHPGPATPQPGHGLEGTEVGAANANCGILPALLFGSHSPFDCRRNAISELVHNPDHMTLVVELDMKKFLTVD